MAKKAVNVGLIGYQFMGKAHSHAYRNVNAFFDLSVHVRMHTLCGRTEGPLKEAAAQFGWENTETDWRKLLANPEIDVVDIATPGNMHAEIAIAAAKAGKAVLCEKPIGNTLAEAEAMLKAVQDAGVPHGVFHNYRKAPAVALAKRMIESGDLGEIYHFRANYLQDWIVDPSFPLVWRLRKEVCGSGTHGDLAAHIIDTARYLVGEFSEVSGLLHTFIKERPMLEGAAAGLGVAHAGKQMGEVDVDDASLFMARFKSGALGMFEASRFCQGRKNYNRWEVNGSKGSLVFNLERMNELEYYTDSDASGEKGFRLIQATDSSHPYAGNYWPVAHIIGYGETFTSLIADAMRNLAEGKRIEPDFVDGYENQRVLDAVERSSASKSWVTL